MTDTSQSNLNSFIRAKAIEQKELLFQAVLNLLGGLKLHLYPYVILPRQANPAADEASPAAVGKLLTEQIWRLYFTSSCFPAFLHSSRTKH
jgi:hypothetical protein